MVVAAAQGDRIVGRERRRVPAGAAFAGAGRPRPAPQRDPASHVCKGHATGQLGDAAADRIVDNGQQKGISRDVALQLEQDRGRLSFLLSAWISLSKLQP